MNRNAEKFKMLWSKLFIRSLAYIAVGLIGVIMSYKASVISMFLSGFILAAGVFMMIISLVSFVRFLMG